MELTHNYLNLPETAHKGATTVAYVYNAAGEKLRKTLSINGVPTVIRDYADGIEYNNDVIDIIHTEAGQRRKMAPTTIVTTIT